MPHCICLLMLTIVKGFSYSKVHCLKSGYSELSCEYEYFISRTRFYFAIHPLFINLTLYYIAYYFFVSSFQAAVCCYSNTFEAMFKCTPSTALDSCHVFLEVELILHFIVYGLDSVAADYTAAIFIVIVLICLFYFDIFQYALYACNLGCLAILFLYYFPKRPKHTLWYLTVWYTGVCYSFL